MLDLLEKNRKGLNLTIEVLDGIKKHSKTGKTPIIFKNEEDYPLTLEGEVVRFSDTIAYVNHDVDDAVRSGILRLEDLPEDTRKCLGNTHSMRINSLVSNVIMNSMDKRHISMSKEVLDVTENLRDFLFDNVYKNPVITIEMDKAKNILHELYRFLIKNMVIVHEKLNKANYNPDGDKKDRLLIF